MSGSPYCANCNARHRAGIDCKEVAGVRLNTTALKAAKDEARAERARSWNLYREEAPLDQLIEVAVARYVAEAK